MSLRRVGGPLVVTLLAAGLCGPGAPSSAAQDADDDAAFERFVQRRIPGMTREERDARARANGPLRIRGRVRAYGKLFATSVHFEPGAEVDASEGLVVYSLGPIVIDAPIRAGTKFRPRKEGVGAKGADGAEVSMISAEDITVNADVVGGAGASGADVDVKGPKGKGGDGGRGGDVELRVASKTGTITVNAVVTGGEGGNGGVAVVEGAEGAPGKKGQSANAVGGNGGDAGRVSIRATNVVFAQVGLVKLTRSSYGGTAAATGGAGGAASNCFLRPGAGGDAKAAGGRAGKGSDAVVTAKTLLPAGFGADQFATGSTVLYGGDATARGGPGGAAFNCPDAEGVCPARGRKGADGGDGGAASAKGGDGNVSSRLYGPGLLGRSPPAVEDYPTSGGPAFASGGRGATGGAGESAERPGPGGTGGDSGSSTAVGGRGGDCRVGVLVSAALGIAGDGGNATVGEQIAPVRSGDGGRGGNCCDHPGGSGGAGGRPGVVRPQSATTGRVGRGIGSGVDGRPGTKTEHPAAVGANGAPGTSCPGLAYEASVTPNPTTHNQVTNFSVQITNTDVNAIEVTVELYHLRPGSAPYLISRQTVTVPAASGPTPGVQTVTGFGSPPTTQSGQQFQVKVNGKEVDKVPFTVN